MRITVGSNGVLVRRGLENLAAEMPEISRQRFRTLMERIKRRVEEYPAEMSGAKIASSHPVLGTTYRGAQKRYQRTGNFGRAWRILETTGGYMIENTIGYGVYVMGDAYGQRQRWGHWQLFRNVVDEEVDKLPAEFEEHIRMVARRVGL